MKPEDILQSDFSVKVDPPTIGQNARLTVSFDKKLQLEQFDAKKKYESEGIFVSYSCDVTDKADIVKLAKATYDMLTAAAKPMVDDIKNRNTPITIEQPKITKKWGHN